MEKWCSGIEQAFELYSRHGETWCPFCTRQDHVLLLVMVTSYKVALRSSVVGQSRLRSWEDERQTMEDQDREASPWEILTLGERN